MPSGFAQLSRPAVKFEAREAALVEKVATSPARRHSRKTPARIAQELIDRLRKRVARSPNSRVMRAIAMFLATRDDEALRFAYRITRDWDLAQRALDQTYNELLVGRTRLEVFFHALKLNARNELSVRATARGRLVSLETLRARSGGEEAGSSDESSEESEPRDFASHRWDDQDPLDILIARDEHEEHRRQVEEAKEIAMTDWRFCWIGQKKWGKALGISTARTRKVLTI